MSSLYLASELLDDIVDLLYEERYALQSCCLASKSWIPRTRKHLFANVEFHTKWDLQSWKEVFPDPPTSPAHYTKSLTVCCPIGVTMVDVEWIKAFSSVQYLKVDSTEDFDADDRRTSFIPFHGFSPALDTLHVICKAASPSRIIDFTITFPHLQTLRVSAGMGSYDNEGYELAIGSDDPYCPSSTIPWPPNMPAFTGTLEIDIRSGLRLIAPTLSSLPGGLRFRQLILKCRCEERADSQWAEALVRSCSSTLESFQITHECTFAHRLYQHT
jgi:hypothetical protein